MDHPVEAKATRKRTIDTADDDGDADAVALTDAKRRKPSVAGEARGNRAAGLRLGSKLSAVSVRVKPADRRRLQQQLEQDSEDSEQFDEATGESDGVEDDHRQLFSPLPLEETIVDGDGNANGDVVDNDADVDAGDDDAVTLTADELRAKQFDKFVDMMLFGRVRTRFAAADRIMRALRKGGLTPERLAEMPKKSLMAMLMGVQFGAARKATMLQNVSKFLMKNFGGEFPQTMKKLLELPGVGPVTAKLVLSHDMFRRPATAVVEQSPRRRR